MTSSSSTTPDGAHATDPTVETCPLHVDMVITAIDIDERHRFRMLELGLRRGTVIRVTQRSNFHGRVVAKGTERIALDGQTAAHIHVRRAEHPASPTATPTK